MIRIPVQPTATTATATNVIVYEVFTLNISHRITGNTTKFSVTIEMRYPEARDKYFT